MGKYFHHDATVMWMCLKLSTDQQGFITSFHKPMVTSQRLRLLVLTAVLSPLAGSSHFLDRPHWVHLHKVEPSSVFSSALSSSYCITVLLTVWFRCLMRPISKTGSPRGGRAQPMIQSQRSETPLFIAQVTFIVSQSNLKLNL